MEIDSKYIEKFKGKVNEVLNDKNINMAMFMFGLLLGIKDSMRKIGISPFLKELKDEYWQYDELRQVQNGWDNTMESPNIPEGILFLVHQLDYVIEDKKSEWAYYYLIGNAVGLLNSDEIKSTEFQYFINKIPKDKIFYPYGNFENLINDFLIKDVNIKYDTSNQYFYFIKK